MPGPRILVIEDNILNLELVTDLLVDAGYEVVAAGSAEEGIRRAHTDAPALILMDIALPGMDGLAAARVLKADPATAPVPIVALSAHTMKGDEERARAAGCAGYIAKPIDTRRLASRVRRFLGGEGTEPPGRGPQSGAAGGSAEGRDR